MSPHILIVEDQEHLAEICARIVARLGATTQVCHTGEAAVNYMENNRLPDLIVLDISMPGMSGWDFLDIIKQYEETKTIPVIVTTAHGDAANRLVGKLRDVDQYMVKPYTPEDLREAAKSALGLAI
jgi:CheY-like chemotaxis protein